MPGRPANNRLIRELLENRYCRGQGTERAALSVIPVGWRAISAHPALVDAATLISPNYQGRGLEHAEICILNKKIKEYHAEAQRRRENIATENTENTEK
jgi:hypothetical protein